MITYFHMNVATFCKKFLTLFFPNIKNLIQWIYVCLCIICMCNYKYIHKCEEDEVIKLECRITN